MTHYKQVCKCLVPVGHVLYFFMLFSSLVESVLYRKYFFLSLDFTTQFFFRRKTSHVLRGEKLFTAMQNGITRNIFACFGT